MTAPRRIELVEVGPRDGLQNEPEVVPTETKLALITRLIEAGVRRMEVASFVHPKRVPQMADAEAVVAGLPERPDVTYIGLVLNEKGLDRALACRDQNGRGVDEIGCVAVASNGFGERNQGMSWAQSVEVAKRLIARARKAGLSAQVTVSVCFGDPFDGPVPRERVIEIVRRLAEAEPREIGIADTIGVAVPSEVEELYGRAREAARGIPLRAHFHNTRNTGIANAWAAWRAGASVVDASIGGLGGCPFAPRATGNTATEDIVYLFTRSGVETGVDLAPVIAAANWMAEVLGHPLPGAVSRAGAGPLLEAEAARAPG